MLGLLCRREVVGGPSVLWVLDVIEADHIFTEVFIIVAA